MLYEYYPAGGSSLKINLLLAMGHAAESLMEATIRNKSVEFFHKIAPFLHSGHIYPLLLCTPTLFPQIRPSSLSFTTNNNDSRMGGLWCLNRMK